MDKKRTIARSKDVGVSREFLKQLKEKLNEKGLILTNDDLKVIADTTFTVIVEEYFYKFKSFNIKGFGSFNINTSKTRFALVNDVRTSVRVSFVVSGIIKRFLKSAINEYEIKNPPREDK